MCVRVYLCVRVCVCVCANTLVKAKASARACVHARKSMSERIVSSTCLCKYMNISSCVFLYKTVPTYSLYNGNSEDTNPTYGWVHVTIGKVTGRLCSYFYPESHYRVLCRQLGFIDGDEYRSDPPEQEDLPFWTTSFDSCGENSRNLETCRSQSWEKGEVTSVSSYSNGSYSETREPYCYRSPVKAFCYDKPGNLICLSYSMHVRLVAVIYEAFHFFCILHIEEFSTCLVIMQATSILAFCQKINLLSYTTPHHTSCVGLR